MNNRAKKRKRDVKVVNVKRDCAAGEKKLIV